MILISSIKRLSWRAAFILFTILPVICASQLLGASKPQPEPLQTSWSGQSYSELVNKFSKDTAMTTIDLNKAGAKGVEVINRHYELMIKFIKNKLSHRDNELKAFNTSCSKWQKYCIAECDLEYAAWAGGTIRNTMYLAMKYDLLLQRIISLKNRYAFEFAEKTKPEHLFGKWKNIRFPEKIITLENKNFYLENGWLHFKKTEKRPFFKKFDGNLVLITWQKDIFGNIKTLLVFLADGGGYKGAFEKMVQ